MQYLPAVQFLTMFLNQGLGTTVFERKPKFMLDGPFDVPLFMDALEVGSRGRSLNPDFPFAITADWRNHPDPMLTITNPVDFEKEVAKEASTERGRRIFGLPANPNANAIRSVAVRLSGQEGLEWMRGNHLRTGTAIGFGSDNAEPFPPPEDQRGDSGIGILVNEVRDNIPLWEGAIPTGIRYLSDSKQSKLVANREIWDAFALTDRLKEGHKKHLEQIPGLPFLNSVFIQAMNRLYQRFSLSDVRERTVIDHARLTSINRLFPLTRQQREDVFDIKNDVELVCVKTELMSNHDPMTGERTPIGNAAFSNYYGETGQGAEVKRFWFMASHYRDPDLCDFFTSDVIVEQVKEAGLRRGPTHWVAKSVTAADVQPFLEENSFAHMDVMTPSQLETYLKVSTGRSMVRILAKFDLQVAGGRVILHKNDRPYGPQSEQEYSDDSDWDPDAPIEHSFVFTTAPRA